MRICKIILIERHSSERNSLPIGEGAADIAGVIDGNRLQLACRITILLQTVALATVPLVHFNSPNHLKSLDGGAYQVTDSSGVALAGASGKIVGQSLEASNTDIATEFTKLIVTQQAYSANTKVITTANQMSQDLLNVIR